jgi:hypothetical protein
VHFFEVVLYWLIYLESRGGGSQWSIRTARISSCHTSGQTLPRDIRELMDCVL